MSFIFNIGIFHYLLLAFFIFLTGIIGVVVSRDMLRTVMSIFIMSVSVIINFLTFGLYCSKSTDDVNILSVFVLIIASMQFIVALVILFKIYQLNEFLDAEKIKDKVEQEIQGLRLQLEIIFHILIQMILLAQIFYKAYMKLLKNSIVIFL